MSSIPAVKAALMSLLTTALPDTQVIYGPAASVTTLGPRVLEVGDVTGSLAVTSLDLSGMTEQYTVTLTAEVSLPGTDQTVPESQALDDFATVCAVVSADSTLGLSNVAASCSDFELTSQASSNGRSAGVRFSVNVFAVVDPPAAGGGSSLVGSALVGSATAA